ncbi:IclR family transcriptional regulator [Nocardioides ganghwensis]|uniref:Glycerol operon regulatory protein n=1 Tax=Nocardioides ganghwensis TaxID=252230 RepID=A0A4Q2SE18_9ACTN|nr:IclR family transcriptional regulator [Nocardioides ganghwensis]MBD3945679.1 IclR family transcriptional regulator [Nocardioides ganghwensis]RYC01087.1 IclR family transcriptional regulator [Nocardioides ganghwensis]
MPGNVQAVERAAAVLTVVASASRPLGLADIAAAVDLPKTTVHGLLSTLRSVGWVEQDRPTGAYRVSRALAGIAQSLDVADLRSAATPWMDALAAETGLEVHLVRIQGSAAVVVQHVYRPDNSPQRLRVGEEMPLHATASGKVLLANATPEPVAAAARPERFTRHTLVEGVELEAELDRVRRDGYAMEVGEYYPDVSSVAVPVRDSLGDTAAALAVLGPRQELPSGNGRPDLVTPLVRAAGSVSRTLWISA